MLLSSFPSTKKWYWLFHNHTAELLAELQDAVVPSELQEEAYPSFCVFTILRVEFIRSEQLGSFVPQHKENGGNIKDNVRESRSRVADTKSEAPEILWGHCCYYVSPSCAYADSPIRKELEGGF